MLSFSRLIRQNLYLPEFFHSVPYIRYDPLFLDIWGDYYDWKLTSCSYAEIIEKEQFDSGNFDWDHLGHPLTDMPAAWKFSYIYIRHAICLHLLWLVYAEALPLQIIAVATMSQTTSSERSHCRKELCCRTRQEQRVAKSFG